MSSTQWGVYLTKEAITEYADTFIADYIHYGKFLDCTLFNPDPQYLSVIAAPNVEESLATKSSSKPHEFLIPHRYVLYVATNLDRKILGFGSKRQAVDTRRVDAPDSQ